jgi:hypothetical protein
MKPPVTTLFASIVLLSDTIVIGVECSDAPHATLLPFITPV